MVKTGIFLAGTMCDDDDDDDCFVRLFSTELICLRKMFQSIFWVIFVLFSFDIYLNNDVIDFFRVFSPFSRHRGI